jgi:hypothetical protein
MRAGFAARCPSVWGLAAAAYRGRARPAPTACCAP